MTTTIQNSTSRCLAPLLLIVGALLTAPATLAQENLSSNSKQLYDHIKAFSLTGGSAEAAQLVLKRDRVEMTFDGAFYFASPIEGRVTGAVFIGQGRFRAEVPPSDFEKDNVRRMLGTDIVESDFSSAVLRFTDDAFDHIGRNRREGGVVNDRAQKLALEVDPRILKETGANLSARLALSILNSEKPGFFFANFDGGRRGRFSFLIDYQSRIPAADFEINGGEKGLIFASRSPYGNDVWMAFYGLGDYERGAVEYSDTKDLVGVDHYQMDVDVRDPKSRLKLVLRLTAQVRQPNLRAISFQIGESLGEYENERLKKQMRVKSVRFEGLTLATIQEDWEGGLTLFLPRAAPVGQKLHIEMDLEGNFMHDSPRVSDCFYPASNTSWYPRHGYLNRSTFDLTYLHRKNRRIASVGVRLSEEPASDDKDSLITRYRMQNPVAFVTFGVGPFERHKPNWDRGGDPTLLEFNSLPGSYLAIKEDFILAELDNCLRYFNAIFGKYPYPVFGAAFHPFGFGQGFPSLLMIPATDRASKYTHAFIAHETAHQWWGNIVAWRSYRDQWLSEGFAEYSGLLYTAFRDHKKGVVSLGTNQKNKAQDDLIRRLRQSLTEPPVTTTGIGEGRLADVGPIVLGHRLNTRKTFGAYGALIYNKGALVLRMLHFLMSNPVSGDDQAFFAMMTDFVNRYRDHFASTDDFRAVANEHFARTPIARKYRLNDLNWFFNQWVYQAGLPSYHLEYEIVEQAGGAVVVRGTVIQSNAPDEWFMPIPLVFFFGGEQEACGTVHAKGPKTPFEVKLPMRPKKVELDPYHWILSEKTSTKGK